MTNDQLQLEQKLHSSYDSVLLLRSGGNIFLNNCIITFKEKDGVV